MENNYEIDLELSEEEQARLKYESIRATRWTIEEHDKWEAESLASKLRF